MPIIEVEVDQQGNLQAWKAIVGGRRSHKMAKPLFPDHEPNYSFDKGVLLRIKSYYHVSGPQSLSSEYMRRR